MTSSSVYINDLPPKKKKKPGPKKKRFTTTVLPNATRSKMGGKKQKIKRVRRPAVTYNPNREEEMIWLRLGR